GLRRFLLTLFLLTAIISSFGTPFSGKITAASQASQDLEPMQGYLDAAPDGMDVRYAWTVDGGRGENVRIIDIEVDWNLSHTDLVTATANPFVFVEGID